MKTFNKILQIMLLGLICSIPASAAITYTARAASHQNGGTGGTSAVTINSQVAANMNVCSVLWCGNGSCNTSTSGYAVSIADTAGSTYTQDKRLDSATVVGVSMAVFHASINASGNNTITVTLSPSTGVNFATIMCSEWNGLAASPTDQTGTTDLNNTASPISVTAGGATAQASELVYAEMDLGGGGGTIAAGTGYTLLNTPSGSTRDLYQIVSSIATYTATGTFSGTVPQRAILVTYKGSIPSTNKAPPMTN